jgi:SAM-dependent methyltransferase
MLRDPENVESQFIHHLLGPSAGDVLEVGCGDGRLTEGLINVSARIMGLDPDPDSISQARSLQENGVRLILGSGESIPLADDSVDTIVFSLSLHHHPDPDNALVQAQRVLREQGRILVLEPWAESAINQLFRIIHNEDEAYERAVRAIDTCGLEMADRGTYETAWRFDDFEELVGHLFSYFELEPDPESMDSMARLLGDRCELKPLDIEDITQYWLLHTDSSRDRAQVP